MVTEQRRVIERLNFLHAQDHKLADIWQTERERCLTDHTALIEAAHQWAAPEHHRCIPGIDPICPTCERLVTAVEALVGAPTEGSERDRV